MRRFLPVLALVVLAACNNDPPRIVSISPDSGPLGGGTTISVTGVNFDAKTTVWLNGAPCTGVSLVSSGSLNGITPPGAALGGATLTVKNDDGQRDHVHNGFTYSDGASGVTVTSLSPNTGAAGTSVSIAGSGFQANATVQFGSNAATSVNVQSTTTITCVVPAGSGAVTVTVTNTDGGTNSLASGFTYSGTTATSTKTASAFAGTGTAGNGGDGGTATSAQLSAPQQIAVGSDGSVYVADTGNNRVRKITSAGAISTIAGASGELNSPRGVCVDGSGNVYIADSANQVVKKLPSGGSLAVYAGTAGSSGPNGDGGAATSAQLSTPIGIAIDGSNNLFIADSGNNKVREVNGSQQISTFAGTGTAGVAGDGSAATSAQLNNPCGVLVDTSANVYIADTGNGRVRKVTGGNISTFAGGGSTDPGDGGSATAAVLKQPYQLAEDGSNGIVIADFSGNIVRIVSGGTIQILAGNYTAGTNDTGNATQLTLNGPRGVCANTSGAYWISDTNNNKILKVQ